MTGLDKDNDVIIEVACIVTDWNLNLPLEPDGYEAVIHQSQETMDQMGEWCTNQHGRSGLTDKVLTSTITAQQAADELLSYIQKYVPTPGLALLAGNTVHADQAFLRRAPFTKVIEHLHHRILDVSCIKEAARRWGPQEVLINTPAKSYKHTSMSDIKESIEEMRYWRDSVFLGYKG